MLLELIWQTIVRVWFKMVKEKKLIKVKALGPYKVQNVKKGINYNFIAGQIQEVQEVHLNFLIDAKIVEEIK